MVRTVLQAGFVIALACTLSIGLRPAAGAINSRLNAALDRAAQRPPDPQAALELARNRLAEKIAALDDFLAASGDRNARLWKEWLDLASLKTELARAELDEAALENIRARYYQNQAGLELPAFLAVRHELHGLLAAREYATMADPQEQYQQRLAELSQSLARMESAPTHSEASRAGAILSWLAPLSDEGAELAAAVHKQHCRPNASAQVSRRFIDHLLGREVEERSYLTDMILGTYTQGPSYTSGKVSFGIVPSSEKGTLEVRLYASNVCPANVAQRRNVSVYTAANTSIQATKQVHISDLGLSLAPAAAASSTTVQINDIDARFRFIERLAWRRAEQMLPQAEAAAEQRARLEASTKLDQQADAALGGVNKMYCENIRAPLLRLGALPAQMAFSTDGEHLRLSMLQHNSAQLAAASDAPAIPPSRDLAACVHESMVNNLCETLLGGTTIHDKNWLELMNMLTGASPRALWVHDRGERWSVTLAKERPIEVRFQEQSFDVTLRLSAIDRGGHSYIAPAEVHVRMLLKKTVEGPAFERQGDVEVRFVSTPPEAEQALAQMLKRKFSAVFPQHLALSGMVPPTGGSLGKLRSLQLVECRTNDGWFELGYELSAAEDAR